MTIGVKIKVGWYSSEHRWKRENLWISAENDWMYMRAHPARAPKNEQQNGVTWKDMIEI